MNPLTLARNDVSTEMVDLIGRLIAGQCLVFHSSSRQHPILDRGRVMFEVFGHDFREVKSQSGSR